MKTLGKITDSVVIVGSVAVGYGAVMGLIGGVKAKNTSAILLTSVTLLIAIYAGKEAISKIND
jgi:hypothetical protein